MKLLWIALGGALGSSLRFLTYSLSYKIYLGNFPLGTFLVNVIGSLLIGFLWGLYGDSRQDSYQRAFLFIGLLGGFTTFSTFALEGHHLLKMGAFRMAAWYILGSNLSGLAAVFAGYLLSKASIQLIP